MKKIKEIYLDYAASTPVDPRVKKAMEPFWSKKFANPRSIHSKGKEVNEAINAARKTISNCLGVHNSEVVFTSGGTESNNLAIIGTIKAAQKYIKKPHVIISEIEHSSVLEAVKQLEKENQIDVTFIPVDRDGVVKIKYIDQSIKKNTVLVSCMYVNNETGSIEPIKKISLLIKNKKNNINTYPYLHTDASQAVRFMPVKPNSIGVDLMTIDSQKIYGPKGVGVLYVKNNVNIKPLVYGGGQEGNLRSGTENVPGIIGVSKAFEIAVSEREKNYIHISQLKQTFIDELSKAGVDFDINGSFKNTVPGILSVSFSNKKGEDIVISLDTKKVYVSTASACSSDKKDISHVILAITNNKKLAENVVRFSFGNNTTKQDIKEAVSRILHVLKR